MGYRTELYDRYESTFKRRKDNGPAQVVADRLLPFRGWLPADRDTPIVDVGCGTGDLLLALQGAGYNRLFGVDVGSEQVTAARKCSLNVEQGDAIAYLNANPGAFRVIIACDVLEHFTRDEAMSFVLAAQRSCGSDGYLLVRVPNAAAPRGSAYQFGDLTHEIAFSPGSLRQLFDNLGARRIEIREDGPSCSTPLRAIRYMLWKGVRTAHRIADIIETGTSMEVYTRNMVARIEV